MLPTASLMWASAAVDVSVTVPVAPFCSSTRWCFLPELSSVEDLLDNEVFLGDEAGLLVAADEVFLGDEGLLAEVAVGPHTDPVVCIDIGMMEITSLLFGLDELDWMK